jgi:PIN domain nuclease of toxin-antitoxin system
MTTKYLLDTHAFLWAAKGTTVSLLGEDAKNVIEDPESELYISSASIFEIANKYRIGKLPEHKDTAENYMKALRGLKANELPLDWEQADFAGKMEWQHKDPFDRMLAAQTQMEGMTLITCDKAFDDVPGVATLW